MQSLQGTSEIFQMFPPNLIFLNVKLVIGFVLDRHTQLNSNKIKHLKSNVLIQVSWSWDGYPLVKGNMDEKHNLHIMPPVPFVNIAHRQSGSDIACLCFRVTIKL